LGSAAAALFLGALFLYGLEDKLASHVGAEGCSW